MIRTINRSMNSIQSLAIMALILTVLSACSSITKKTHEASVVMKANEIMPNTVAGQQGVLFRAISDNDQGCGSIIPTPGEITYSDLAKLGPNQWLYVRDTKKCAGDKRDLRNKYFGVVYKQDQQLLGTEVSFDDMIINRDDMPNDLEAFCLLNQPNAQNADFEIIAVESGGYQPQKNRHLFHISFSSYQTEESSKPLYKATSISSVDYHPLIEIADAPNAFQAEGLLCQKQQDGRFKLILANRGSHQQRFGAMTELHAGGLLTTVVDFSGGSGKIDFSKPVQYVEVIAPKCQVSEEVSITSGEWRDMSSLFQYQGKVWSTSVFEGQEKLTDKAAKNHFCTNIYPICNDNDCNEVLNTPKSHEIDVIEVPNKKIEGLAMGAQPNTFSYASDEETSGDIHLAFDANQTKAKGILSSVHRTSDLSDIVKKAMDSGNPSKVLVVFDLDDTLLTMTQDLGGVAWFDWQDQILDGAYPMQQASMQVADNFGELLRIQGILYETNDMVTAQDNTKALVDQLQQRGISTYVLTARGPEFLSATQRVLKETGMDFKSAPECEGLLCNKRGMIPKAHVKATVEQMIKDVDSEKFNRRVNIEHGVMMVSGLNKGVMLRLLLKHLPNHIFDTVIFADDSLKNVVNVSHHADKISKNTHVYHYVKLEDKVNGFFKRGKDHTSNNRQKATDEAWKAMRKSVCDHHTMSWCTNTKD